LQGGVPGGSKKEPQGWGNKTHSSKFWLAENESAKLSQRVVEEGEDGLGV